MDINFDQIAKRSDMIAKVAPYLKLAAAILAFLFVTAAPNQSVAQTEQQNAAATGGSSIGAEATGALSFDELKKWRSAIENASDLAGDVKKSVLSYLDRAILFRERENQLREEISDIRQQVKAAPERIRAIEAELDKRQPPPEDVAAAAAKLKPDDLQQHLRKLEVDLSDALNRLNNLTDQLNVLKNQPANLQQEIVDGRKRLQEISEELKSGPGPAEAQAVFKARQGALAVEQSLIATRINNAESRLTNNDILTALVSAERDLATREVSRQEALVKSWRAEVQRIRELEAKQGRVVAEQAKKTAVNLPPVIQEQFDVNIELGKMLEKVIAEQTQVADRLKFKQDQLKQIEADYALAQEQVKYPMHTEAIALALLEQRRNVPSMASFRRDSDRRQVQMGEIRSRQLDLDRQQRDLADIDQAMDRMLQDQEFSPDTDTEALKTELRRLLSDRRELLRKLQAEYQRLFKNLQSLEFIDQQVAAKAEEEALFLDTHLLWIRNARSVGLKELRNVPAALQWLLSPLNWWQVLQDLLRSLWHNPFMWALVLLISLTFMVLRRRAHRELSRIASGVYSVKSDSFVLTLRAIAVTARAAFGWPLLMMFAGWQLLNSSQPQEHRPGATGMTLLGSSIC